MQKRTKTGLWTLGKGHMGFPVTTKSKARRGNGESCRDDGMLVLWQPPPSFPALWCLICCPLVRFVVPHLLSSCPFCGASFVVLLSVLWCLICCSLVRIVVPRCLQHDYRSGAIVVLLSVLWCTPADDVKSPPASFVLAK